MLIGLFERCMKRRGVKESDPYDWEKVPNVTSVTDNAVPPAATTSPAILTRPATGILGATRITDNLLEDNLITSLDNNQENIEPDNRRELEVRWVLQLSYWCKNFWIMVYFCIKYLRNTSMFGQYSFSAMDTGMFS